MNQLHQPSGSTRSTLPATAAGHPNNLGAPDVQVDAINPLLTLLNPAMARARPYSYLGHPSRVHLPPYMPNHLYGPTSMPSQTVATPSSLLPVGTQSTRHTYLQPPSTRPFPAQLPSTPLTRKDTRPVPSKRARGYSPIPPTLYHTPPIPSSLRLSSHVPPPIPRLGPTQTTSERPAKRPRLDVGHSSSVAAPPRPTPKHRKGPLHPLAVDYGRPVRPVTPHPPFCRMSLRQNHIPLPPSPESLDSKRLLDDELKGPLDPAVANELGDLMRMQQKRVWNNRNDYSDPLLRSIPTSLPEHRSSSSYGGVVSAQSQPETVALYGPPSRDNESIHLGESLTNPNVIVLDDDEDGFEGVLDLYRGAVQGSTLSMELELTAGGGVEVGRTSWEAASSLEVGIKRKYSAQTTSGGSRESRIRTLVEYRQVVRAEKAVSPTGPTITEEESALGIKWSYSSCGYAAGKVVDVHSINVTTSTHTYGSNGKRRL